MNPNPAPLYDVTVRVDGSTLLRTSLTMEERDQFLAGFGTDAQVEVKPATAQMMRAGFG